MVTYSGLADLLIFHNQANVSDTWIRQNPYMCHGLTLNDDSSRIYKTQRRFGPSSGQVPFHLSASRIFLTRLKP